MEEMNLKNHAENFAKYNWGVEFKGKVKVTPKLLPLRQYGRFVPESNTVYVASQIFAHTDRYDFAIRVLEHELCHWYCYNNGLEYHDGTTDFEDFLQEYGCITNGNYPFATKKIAFSDIINPMECKKCGLAQFDRLKNTRDILLKSHCCNSELEGMGKDLHTYYYFDYGEDI